jgi:ribA/ribD-fused uncharacterized protein
MTWACSEQAYMYYKSTDKSYQKAIRRATNPYDAKRLGRQVDLRPHWDDMKYEIMYNVVLAKFSQNSELEAILLSTGTLPIHENCKDPWWGGGPKFPSGKDWLGKILMRVRAELQVA